MRSLNDSECTQNAQRGMLLTKRASHRQFDNTVTTAGSEAAADPTPCPQALAPGTAVARRPEN
jgi:hypothetical protein